MKRGKKEDGKDIIDILMGEFVQSYIMGLHKCILEISRQILLKDLMMSEEEIED
jgi:hypothetical protein